MFILTILIGCASQTQYKEAIILHGVNLEYDSTEAAQIVYKCKQEATFRNDSTRVIGEYASSSSSMKLDENLYKSCLKANGLVYLRCPADAITIDDARCAPYY